MAVNNKMDARAETTIEREGTDKRADSTPRFELLMVLVALGIFLAINVFTAARSPVVWCDEVMYQDPAVNLYQGHGFTSGAWFLQARDQFWAGNMPLYQFVLYVWLKVFGFSITTVRSLHYVLMSAAVIMGWLAVRRLGLIRVPSHRLIFCLVVCLSTSTTFVYRSARPDSLGVLLLALALLSFSIRIRWVSLLMLLVCGILLIACGVQLAAYVATMAGLVVVLGPRRLVPEMSALCAGCAVGAGLGWLFYSHHGVWKELVDAIGHHTIANNGIKYPIIRNYGDGFSEKLKQVPFLYSDYSFLPLFAFAVLMCCGFKRAGHLTRSSPLFFGVVASVFVPLCLHTVGVFPLYYFWMAFTPLAVGIFSGLGPWLELKRAKTERLFLILCVGLACAAGLPRRLVVAGIDWTSRDYAPVMKLAEPYVSHDKLVACDFAAYYAAKQYGAEVVLPTHFQAMSAEDKAKVSTAIFKDSGAALLAEQFGGTWQDTGSRLDPLPPPRLFSENLDSRQYHLRVFVRTQEK